MRELRNVIERACILADGDFITERELANSLPAAGPAAAAPVFPSAGPQAFVPAASPESDLLVNVERDHIQRALVRANGNKKAAAKMLGLSRRALYRRLERLDLVVHHLSPPGRGPDGSVSAGRNTCDALPFAAEASATPGRDLPVDDARGTASCGRG